MYKGFNLSINDYDNYFKNPCLDYYNSGKEMYDKKSNLIHNQIENFMIEQNGHLDGNKIQEEWFPAQKADIFLSHSHLDFNKTLYLAGWLEETFGLNVFIDSCVWGYANDLLKLIDDKYCKSLYDNSMYMYYDYQKRNFSTSHVHLMLSTALRSMIDRSECIIFFNTPNSITTYNNVINENATSSPWIYDELIMTKLIRKTKPNRMISKAILDSTGDYQESKHLDIDYFVDITHLIPLTSNNLNDWGIYNKEKNFHPLDRLYSLTGGKIIYE